MTKDEALKEYTKQKEQPGTPAHFISKLTETAHPAVKEMIERQAVTALIAGHKFAQMLDEADKDPEMKKKMMLEFQRMSTQVGPMPDLEELLNSQEEKKS